MVRRTGGGQRPDDARSGGGGPQRPERRHEDLAHQLRFLPFADHVRARPARADGGEEDGPVERRHQEEEDGEGAPPAELGAQIIATSIAAPAAAIPQPGGICSAARRSWRKVHSEPGP